METELAQEPRITTDRKNALRPLSRSFHITALLEGVSFLLILFVTMPLKYLMDMPGPNMVIGMAHGVLFLAYTALILEQMFSKGFSIRWGIYAFIASLVPFGTFIFVARHQKAAR